NRPQSPRPTRIGETNGHGHGEASEEPRSGSVVVVTAPATPSGEKRRCISRKDAARQAVEATERALIEEALKHTLWNRRKAAKLLDISYSSLLRRIDAYNIAKPDGQ